MSSYDHDDMGNRMKFYEQEGFHRAYVMPGETFVIRLDGRAFSTFTKDFKKPYDPFMSQAMENTMRKLTEEFNAALGHTQSDEISLVFFSNVDDQVLFGGRVQKLITTMAARATILFNVELLKTAPHYIKEGQEPTFDARIVPLPSRVEAYNCVLWRQFDATKNAISMAAHSMFSQTRLHGLTGSEKLELMFKEKGINFAKYPPFFKRGVFARPFFLTLPIDEETLARMPTHIAEEKRGQTFLRRQVNVFDCWINRSGDTFDERWVNLFGSDVKP